MRASEGAHCYLAPQAARVRAPDAGGWAWGGGGTRRARCQDLAKEEDKTKYNLFHDNFGRCAPDTSPRSKWLKGDVWSI